jgi:hypothetical protein
MAVLEKWGRRIFSEKIVSLSTSPDFSTDPGLMIIGFDIPKVILQKMQSYRDNYNDY